MKWYGVALLFTLVLVQGVLSRSEPFMLGADVSWIDQRENEGVVYSDNGTVKDIFLILKEHGFNWIRLRIFVDPTAVVPGTNESPYSRDGYCDLAHTRKMVKRAKKAGFKVLLDFHYSDVWADPAKQFKPVSWNGLSFDELAEKVRTYTKETLQQLMSDSVLPDMVQVGNEVAGGFIWPDGRSSTMSKFAALVNAGIDGVKEVSPSCKIMIHSIAEKSPSNWLKALINAGVNRIDVFGLSYYSTWHGTPDSLKIRLQEVARNHSVKIAVAEYADNHRVVNEIVYDLPNEKGVGTFCWEPEEWMEALFDWKNGRRETNSKIDLYPAMATDFEAGDILVAGSGGTRQHMKTTALRRLEPDKKRELYVNLHGRIIRSKKDLPTCGDVLSGSSFYIIFKDGPNHQRVPQVMIR